VAKMKQLPKTPVQLAADKVSKIGDRLFGLRRDVQDRLNRVLDAKSSSALSIHNGSLARKLSELTGFTTDMSLACADFVAARTDVLKAKEADAATAKTAAAEKRAHAKMERAAKKAQPKPVQKALTKLDKAQQKLGKVAAKHAPKVPTTPVNGEKLPVPKKIEKAMTRVTKARDQLAGAHAKVAEKSSQKNAKAAKAASTPAPAKKAPPATPALTASPQAAWPFPIGQKP
jgi:hypothetical protein